MRKITDLELNEAKILSVEDDLVITTKVSKRKLEITFKNKKGENKYILSSAAVTQLEDALKEYTSIF